MEVPAPADRSDRRHQTEHARRHGEDSRRRFLVFKVAGIEIEGSNEMGVDVQYPWEEFAQTISPARHPDRFLLHRQVSGDQRGIQEVPRRHALPTERRPEFPARLEGRHFPQGWENRPVTWVSLEDARAYAAWAGKRLPHEWEWQYAAQGTDGRLYPWGEEWNAGAVPVPDKSRTMRGPDPVDAHPGGASPFGVMDLVGNVWQWTDEFADEHTRGRNSARRQLLSAPRLHLVFSASL